MSIKLTFNKPASHYMVEQNHKGIRIKLADNGGLLFKTVATVSGDDVAPITPRTRGGFEVFVEGSHVDEIKTALKNVGPFHIVERHQDGWMATKPFIGASANDAPPKFQPHVRLWDQEAKPAASRPAPQKHFVKTNSDLVGVREAYALLRSPARAGRPTNEERQQRSNAQAVVDEFEAIAREHMNLLSDQDIRDLNAARDMIDATMRRFQDAPVATPVAEPTKAPRKAPTKTVKAKAKAKAPKAQVKAKTTKASTDNTPKAPAKAPTAKTPVKAKTTKAPAKSSPSSTTVVRKPTVKAAPAPVVMLKSRTRRGNIGSMSKSRHRLVASA